MAADRHASRPATPMVGAGFKPEHLAQILAEPPALDLFEVHAENYMGAGGPPHRMLGTLRERFALSVHGVCLSIGGSRVLDAAHLARFAELVRRYQPALVSEHLAWSSHAGVFYNDLLPLPYTRATLEAVCAHVDQVQQAIGRTLLLENPATYITFASSTLSETEFLRAVARRTGCGLLLDLSNALVAATNHGRAVQGYLDDFPLECVGQIHLAGYTEQRDDEGAPLLIDSHDRVVCDRVWALYQQVVARLGPRPTVVEWDSALPVWPVLREQALRARRIVVSAGAARPARSRAMLPEAPLQPPDWCATFTPGLLDPRRAAPPGVAAHAGKAVARRYDVYRNNVMSSLVAALAAIYPALQRSVGAELFGALAREHVRATPPASPLLFEYGRGFAAFIAAHEATRAQPVLADVTRIERAWLDAYHAADAPVLGAAALAAVAPAALARLRLRAHPAARIVRSRYAALDLFTCGRAPDRAAAPCSDAAQDTLITRPEQQVIVSHLPAGAAAFLSSLIDGQTLEAAAAAGFDAHPAFDLQANLASMLTAGVFTAMQTKDET